MNVSMFVAFCPHCGERMPNAKADTPAGDHFQTQARCGSCGFVWRFDLIATPVPAALVGGR